MKAKTAILVIMLMCAVVLLLSAQKKERELTVEELYLENIELQILREQAYSDDRDMKIAVLDSIEKMVDEGKASEDISPVLQYLSMEGTSHRVRENNRLINYFPEVRRRSTNLLGRIGGEDAKNTLITVLIKDDEAMVRAEAAYALGVIGVNDDNRVVNALVYSLDQENPDRPDNNFAYAICLAMEKIAKANNGVKNPEAYRVLVRIAQGNYIKTVKRKAMQTLEEMKKY